MVLRVVARDIRQEKEIKALQIANKKLKLSLLTDYMILRRGEPKDKTKRLLELIRVWQGSRTTKSVNINQWF